MKTINNKFAIFILSYGRPDRVYTYNTLRRSGYTGKIYIVINSEDPQIDDYFNKYPDEVVVFNKADYIETFDIGDNFNGKPAVVYARNACFDIAEKLGYKYFMEYDDDYKCFDYRLYKDGKVPPVKNLDNILNALLDYFITAGFKDLAMAQGGDFIGGRENQLAKTPILKRKCMNTHILSTDRRFNFVGRINEDVNTPLVLGSKGDLFGTIPFVSVTQKNTQSNPGGLTDIYLDVGTYVKSFYSVMFAPSCCTVSTISDRYTRLHHRVMWNNAVPKVISEQYRKAN